jgi:hypothetical protein
MVEMNKIQELLTSAISSPSRTPLSSPFGLSPNPPSYMSPVTPFTSPESNPDVHTQPMAPLQLSEPMLNINDWTFDHSVDSQLRLCENFSFPGVTPGDEYRHVKLASSKEQEAFIEQITTRKEFTEMFVSAVLQKLVF